MTGFPLTSRIESYRAAVIRPYASNAGVGMRSSTNSRGHRFDECS